MTNSNFILQKGNKGAAINTNRESYGSYHRQRNLMARNLAQGEQIENLQNQVRQIQEDQTQIKELLLQLLEKNK